MNDYFNWLTVELTVELGVAAVVVVVQSNIILIIRMNETKGEGQRWAASCKRKLILKCYGPREWVERKSFLTAMGQRWPRWPRCHRQWRQCWSTALIDRRVLNSPTPTPPLLLLRVAARWPHAGDGGVEVQWLGWGSKVTWSWWKEEIGSDFFGWMTATFPLWTGPRTTTTATTTTAATTATTSTIGLFPVLNWNEFKSRIIKWLIIIYIIVGVYYFQ